MKAHKERPAFDVAKIGMCFLIMVIHIMPVNTIPDGLKLLAPVTRVAVPVFFMISGYLFFSKLKLRSTETSKRDYLKKMIFRNTKLYLFWSLILLPVTYSYRHYGQFTNLKKVFIVGWHVLFGSTFIASWYLSALVIGLIIIFFLSRHFTAKQILLVVLPAYIWCVLTSNYSKLGWLSFFAHSWLRQSAFSWSPYNSFLVALLWLAIGKAFVDHETLLFKGTKKQLIMILGFMGLLYIEQLIIIYFNSYSTNDCYFTLVPLCAAIFSLLLNVVVHFKRAKILRTFATITYCAHASLSQLIIYLYSLTTLTFGEASLIFLIITVICAVTTLLVTRLERYPHLAWLKYSH